MPEQPGLTRPALGHARSTPASLSRRLCTRSRGVGAAGSEAGSFPDAVTSVPGLRSRAEQLPSRGRTASGSTRLRVVVGAVSTFWRL